MTKLEDALSNYHSRANFHDRAKLAEIIAAVREEERAKFPALIEAAKAITAQMPRPFDARTVVSGEPPEQGGRILARVLIARSFDLESLEIDVSRCRPGLLISAFFNSFLQELYDQQGPTSLASGRKIRWHCAFQYQEEQIAGWSQQFQPMGLESR